jgi:hypothetical protein
LKSIFIWKKYLLTTSSYIRIKKPSVRRVFV